MNKDGTLPECITAQTKLCWQNIAEVLASAGMRLEDIVKATTTIKNEADIPAYGKACNSSLATL